jgi:hypothetical protein
MNESFELHDELVVSAIHLAKQAYSARPVAQVAPGSFEVCTESDRESQAGRSGLGMGLAQITSRLLDQLVTGGVRAHHGGAVTAGDPQRDLRGNLVPRDYSPLVYWRRVVAVSAAGSLLALVSLPVQSGSAGMDAGISPV